ncbi:MAG: Lrp/AsnC family transcriptional regulator [Desulfovibrio sp.]|jgi:DNA-binding Lrp family transcriptional regulator|nr:Lrp/AsnC family transcriptional regulator [Desulfovibrio sp.]
MAVSFSRSQRIVLGIVQENLPDGLEPYAEIAAKAGIGEEEVLDFLRALLAQGAIRRFGASIKHQKAGYVHNAMVAWKITPETADEAGRLAARHPGVSHCYYRPSSFPDWPYELYTMVHGRTRGECERAIEEIAGLAALSEHIVLESLKELKKSSMRYFPLSEADPE